MLNYNIDGIKGITLYITEKCNFNCSYCFLAKKNGSSIDTNLGYKSIDFLFDIASKDTEYIYFTFFGGEPLLEKDLIKKIVLYGNEKSLEYNKPILYNIVTNGSLIDEDFISFISEENFAILLSWDGTPHTQDYHRKNLNGNGFSNKIEESIPHLKKALLNFAVRMTVSPETVNSLYENVKYIVDNGIDHLGFVPTYESNWSNDDFVIFEEQLNLIIDLFLDRFNKNEPIYIQPMLDFLLNFDKKQNHVNHFYMHPCHADTLAIDTKGNIYPCHRFVAFDKESPHYTLGNILNNNFDKSKYLNYLDVRQQLRDKYPSNGGCPAVNYDLNGNVLCVNKNFDKFRIIFERSLEKITKEKNYNDISSLLFK